MRFDGATPELYRLGVAGFAGFIECRRDKPGACGLAGRRRTARGHAIWRCNGARFVVGMGIVGWCGYRRARAASAVAGGCALYCPAACG